MSKVKSSADFPISLFVYNRLLEMVRFRRTKAKHKLETNMSVGSDALAKSLLVVIAPQDQYLRHMYNAVWLS